MTLRQVFLPLLAMLVLWPAGPGAEPAEPGEAASSQGPLVYQVFADQARRNHRVMGPVKRHVQGVPAEPVDSFVWNGVGSDPIEAQLQMELDPVNDTGFILVSWTDSYGEWTYMQTRFIHPEHSSGARFGNSVGEVHQILNEGITHNVYLHGDTGAGPPVLPTVFTHLATWGPATVTLNGELFANPFEIPRPDWLGHLMVTEGVRQADGTVRTKDGSIYDPSRMAEGSVQPGDLEVHLVFHDERFPRTTNIPPLFSFFYHLEFENVSMSVVQREEPVQIRIPSERPVTE